MPAARRSRRAIESLSQANADLKNVIKNLKSGNEEHALAVLKYIRTTDASDESLEAISDSMTLLSSTGDFSQISTEMVYTTRARHDGELSEVSLEAANSTSPDELRFRGRPFTDLSLSENHNDDSRYHHPESMEILPLSQWTSVQGTDK